MKGYRFDQYINQTIVDGILQGYKNYLDERREKKQSMKISSAYAWVRGNHIDDQTATLSEEIGIKYLQARAGFSWGYLQFTNNEERKMFIVKNGRYLNRDNISARRNNPGDINTKVNQEHYLYQLAQINKDIDLPRVEQLELSFDDEIVTFNEDTPLVDIVDDEMSALQKQFDYFYIVSYELDQYSMISRIQLLLPSPVDGRAYIVDDLTELIESSSVSMPSIEPSIAKEEQELHTEYPDAAWFDITTHNDQTDNKKDNK